MHNSCRKLLYTQARGHSEHFRILPRWSVPPLQPPPVRPELLECHPTLGGSSSTCPPTLARQLPIQSAHTLTCRPLECPPTPAAASSASGRKAAPRLSPAARALQCHSCQPTASETLFWISQQRIWRNDSFIGPQPLKRCFCISQQLPIWSTRQGSTQGQRARSTQGQRRVNASSPTAMPQTCTLWKKHVPRVPRPPALGERPWAR